jgi:hypothetical protein
MDFENSLFDTTKINEIFLLYFYFEQILNNILLELNLVTENIDIIINYIKCNKIDITYLLNLIDNIIMIKKRDLSHLKKYDPTIY